MTTPKRVAVIGAGTMGNGIAQTFATHGIPTYLVDVRDDLVERGIAAIEKSLGRFVAKEKLTQPHADEIRGRIDGTTAMDCLREAELVVEAVTERVEIKRQVFERADELAPEIGAYVRDIFDSDDVLNQLTKVQAIVAHLETFPLDRAVAAVRRASFFGSYSYQAIKNILRKGLDMTPLPTVVVPASAATERPRFARDIQELLQFPTEKNDAPH